MAWILAKRLKSVFTDDMDHCYFTGYPYPHIHHIFCGSRRKISERYGFVIPLAPYLHEFQKGSVHDNPNHGLDLELKQMAQRYFEEHIGSREMTYGCYRGNDKLQIPYILDTGNKNVICDGENLTVTFTMSSYCKMIY